MDGGSVTLGREHSEDPGHRERVLGASGSSLATWERLEHADKDLHFVNGTNGTWDA